MATFWLRVTMVYPVMDMRQKMYRNNQVQKTYLQTDLYFSDFQTCLFFYCMCLLVCAFAFLSHSLTVCPTKCLTVSSSLHLSVSLSLNPSLSVSVSFTESLTQLYIVDVLFLKVVNVSSQGFPLAPYYKKYTDQHGTFSDNLYVCYNDMTTEHITIRILKVTQKQVRT